MSRGASFGLLLAFVIAGCEVAPGSRRVPAGSASGTGSDQAAAAKPAEPTAGAGGAAPTPAPTPTPTPTPTPSAQSPVASKESCARAASRLFDLRNAAEQDPAQRTANEQTRASFVNSMTDGCQQSGWSEEAVDCILKAADISGLQPCGQLIQRDQIAQVAKQRAADAAGSGAGSGSAAPTPPAPTPTPAPPPPAAHATPPPHPTPRVAPKPMR